MATDTLTHATVHAHEHGHHDAGGTKIFGFWIYLMSDCILFSILFATYAVLVNGTAGGPTGKDIFELPFVLVETFLLLFSSITYGMAAIACTKQQKPGYLLAGVDLVVWRRIYRDGNLRIPSPDC
ncbi:cytochrome o ubiquinol oxidase subunit III [Escherichia coli]|nr:cytochrome o ubiquinol oxidase subunit III [Escherichia coli]